MYMEEMEQRSRAMEAPEATGWRKQAIIVYLCFFASFALYNIGGMI